MFFPEEMEKNEYAKMIKEIGFDTGFTGDSAENVEITLAAGLEIDNIHAPFDGINNMWYEGMSGDKMLKRLTDTVDLCAQYDIPKAVIHLSSGDNSPHVNDIGISRFDRLVNHAVAKGVSLAFENQRKLGKIRKRGKIAVRANHTEPRTDIVQGCRHTREVGNEIEAVKRDDKQRYDKDKYIREEKRINSTHHFVFHDPFINGNFFNLSRM